MSKSTTTTTSTTSTSSELSKNIPEEIKIRLSESLIKSIEAQELTSIEEFLKIGADVNYRNGLPLKIAIDHDNTEIIDLLSKYGVKTNFGFNLSHLYHWSDDGSIWCPLRYAIGTNKINSIKKFIELKVDPTKKNITNNLSTSEYAFSFMRSVQIQNNKVIIANFGRGCFPKITLEIAILMSDYCFKWNTLKDLKKRKFEKKFTPSSFGEKNYAKKIKTT